MEDEITKSPNIRFTGFTYAWEQCNFGDLAEYKKGPFGSAITKDMFVPKSENSVKVYEQQNAIGKDWRLERYFITKQHAEKLKAFTTNKGDIIVSCAGTIGEIYEIPNEADSGIINQALMRIRVNNSIIDKKMFIILFSNMIDYFSNVHSNGSAIKNIPPFADLKPMITFVPKMEEQKKIVNIFNDINSLINLHQSKLALLKQTKNAMLQKMFPEEGEKIPQIRFAGFTDEWEQSKLNNYIETSKDKNSDDIYTKSDVLSVSGEVGIVNQIEFQGRSFAGVSVTNYGVVNTGDIVYTKSPLKINPHGIIKTNKGEPGIVSTLYAVYKAKENTNPNFVHCYFESNYRLNKYLKPLVNKGAKNDMKVSDDNALLGIVRFPSYDEQTKITQFFEEIDNLISCYKVELDSIINIKKSMLKQMFI